MIRRITSPTALAAALAIAGCAGPSARQPQVARPADMRAPGLDRVIGKPAAALVALFGPADLDGREGQARRLQFVGPACVLDAYLYAEGSGEAVVTYVDARRPDGDDIDRASCVAALARRDAAK